MEDTNSKQNEKNQKIVTLGIAEMGMSIVLCLFGVIILVLGALDVHVPLVLSHIPAIGFFVSLPWIFVCWKLIQSAEKGRDIRQRRRFVLYWTCYAVIVGIFNLGAFILFIVLLISKHHYHANGALVTGTIFVSVILIVRGLIFAAVFIYSKELLREAETSTSTDESHENPSPNQDDEPVNKYEGEPTNQTISKGNSQHHQQTVVVTAV